MASPQCPPQTTANTLVRISATPSASQHPPPRQYPLHSLSIPAPCNAPHQQITPVLLPQHSLAPPSPELCLSPMGAGVGVLGKAGHSGGVGAAQGKRDKGDILRGGTGWQQPQPPQLHVSCPPRSPS